MAISPRQLEDAFKDEIDYYENFIDKILSKESIKKGQTISIDIPSGFSPSHFDVLKMRYIAVGWSEVKWNSDQREGEWLTFKY